MDNDIFSVADIGKFLSEQIVWTYVKYGEMKKRFTKVIWRHSIVDDENNDDEVYKNNNCHFHELQFQLKDHLVRFGIDDYISIPVTLVLSILVAYVAAGALLLGTWEGWDFFTGFYFSFITITTVNEESKREFNLKYFNAGRLW
jgi:hypothetical protein